MKTYLQLPVALIILIIALFACKASNIGSAANEEDLKMKIKEQKDIINPQSLKEQRILSMEERSMGSSIASRGLFSSAAGGLVSMATDAVKKMIANEKEKYNADYEFGLNDLYFYDQLSNDNPFDPVGLQFGGFKLTRTFKNNYGRIDTALIVNFALDTINSAEMINNSTFRLRLKDLTLNYAKAKIDDNSDQKLNMDFEITFLTSYVNNAGVLFDGVVLGKFYYLLRNAPLNKSAKGYKAYYDNLKGELLTGKSFIVPRSFGYHKDSEGNIKPGYSQGAYSIQVKVKESSKDHFVSKIISDNANLIIETTGSKVKDKLSSLIK